MKQEKPGLKILYNGTPIKKLWLSDIGEKGCEVLLVVMPRTGNEEYSVRAECPDDWMEILPLKFSTTAKNPMKVTLRIKPGAGKAGEIRQSTVTFSHQAGSKKQHVFPLEIKASFIAEQGEPPLPQQALKGSAVSSAMKAPAAEKKPPAAEKKPPAAEKKPPVAEKKPPVAEKKPPAAEKKPPAAEKKPPAAEKKPAAPPESRTPQAGTRAPVAEPKAPAAEVKPPVAEAKP
ncbi:MAG: hypothetical protein RDV48_02410, partial [Candidatus Eremiobacteraeota bacterium]|nr:hypothetical protein [Candidatus Eremiobacteraeota bacterium]